jgi:hypothetical protein
MNRAENMFILPAKVIGGKVLCKLKTLIDEAAL